MVEFLPATKNDLAAIIGIDNPSILNSTATFHAEKMSREKLGKFLFIAHPKYPAFVIKDHDEMIGYCFLTRYKKPPGVRPVCRTEYLLKTGIHR